MVNPICEAASVNVSLEVINKNPKNTVYHQGDSAQSEAAAQAVSSTDKSYAVAGIRKSGRNGADHSVMKETKGEVRKSEISDRKLTIKVYDSSGKLLRKIPPGYLPLGEQEFDITI